MHWRMQYTLQLTDPRSGLLVRCVAVEYHDFPTVEWTVYLKNTGSSDTPILEDVQAIDLRLERDAEGEFTLHEHTGDNCSPDSYRPHEFPLYPGTQQAVASPTGRPTHRSPSLLQSGMARCRSHRGCRLAGTMAGQVCARCRPRCGGHRRPGIDAFQAASR